MKRTIGEIMDRAGEMAEKTKGMDPRIRLFIAFYIQTFSSTQAAMLAHYTQNASSAAVQGCKLMKRPDVRKAIDDHLRDVLMPVVEIKGRLSEYARGSMENFLEVTDTDVRIDYKKAESLGALRLIKKFKTKERYIPQGEDEEPIREVTTEIELYDAMEAVVQMGRIEGLFKERVVFETPEGAGPYGIMAAAYQAGLEKDKKLKNAAHVKPRITK